MVTSQISDHVSTATDVAATLESRWCESGGSGAEETGSLAKRRNEGLLPPQKPSPAKARPGRRKRAREGERLCDGRRECRSGPHAR